MSHRIIGSLRWMAVGVVACCAVWPAMMAQAQLGLNEPNTVTLLNGTQIKGRVGGVPEIGATLADAGADASNYGIVLIDDDLRRVFVSRFNVAQKVPLERREEEFEIFQKVDREGSANSEIGRILRITPFNAYGRREITIATYRGPLTMLQGITKANPRYCQVEGLSEHGINSKRWDMRVATSSVPADVLVSILHRQLDDAGNANERLRLVEFFVQAEMYRQAVQELQQVRRDFPGLRAELAEQSDLLRQRIARQVLDEARLRRDSGQPFLARQMTAPLEQQLGIATEILVEINELKKEFDTDQQLVEQTLAEITQLAERVLDSDEVEGNVKAIIEKFLENIKSDLRMSNVDRLSTFMRLASDAEQTDQQKLALALSGWVIGAGSALQNLGVAQSLVEAQALVAEYLQTKRGERREAILQQLNQMEGGAPEYIAKLVAHITPPLAPSPNELIPDVPLTFTVDIPVLDASKNGTAEYLIQLPPEYDPYRRYPCLVTLEGETSNTSAEAQIRWWCGDYNPNFQMRMGQAARHGFIVLAPKWRLPGQTVYQYSAREHAVVLKSLRHAMRRFAIDTDRVFLSGHFSGGDAAWDIGQAHPEHWAGVIPISARAGKYINHYQNNARWHVPFYFVNGSRDFNTLDSNSKVWNDHFRSKDFDTIVVHYLGRGAEKFSDEIHNLFSWMRPLRRQFDVREFECSTMRPWDNCFWWFELDLAGNPRMVYPEEDWQNADRSDWIVEGKVRDTRPNAFVLRGAQNDATLWLLPEIVDFSRDVEISGQSGKFRGSVQPSRRVLLEDVRQRADRQHPYWARITRQNKNWVVSDQQE